MTNLRKFVLVAIIAAPLALYAQPIEKPEAQPQKTASASANTAKSQTPPAKRAFQKVMHGLNPMTWLQYLTQPKEYCTYAYVQAYGYCEGSRGR